MNPKLRFQILVRDGFRCGYCGAVAAETALHVDHKTPASSGGTDDPDNLITSCVPCNLGKGYGVIESESIRFPAERQDRYPGRKRTNKSVSLYREDIALANEALFERETFASFLERAIHHELEIRKGLPVTPYKMIAGRAFISRRAP